jgi:excisionase family DNA binding protein
MPLQKRFKKPEPIAIERRLLSPKQAATYLNISITIVRRMILNRTIPYLRNGRRYLVDRIDLDRWIERRKISATAV